MFRVFAVACLLMSLFASSALLAQPSQQTPQQTGCSADGEACQFVDMENYLVEGGLRGPDGKLIFTPNGASFDRNAQLKRSFRPELESSLADHALAP